MWDFDGVILDSDDIRTDGFVQVLSNHPEELVAELVAYHKANGGLSRYVKFRYFYENILGQSITDEAVSELASAFSKIMKADLGNPALLIQDTLAFIKSRGSQVSMHIVSGSDQNELRGLCRTLGIESYFQSIFGSPTPKISLVKNLLLDQGYRKANVCLIGDSANDYEAAQTNGVDFFGFNNPSLKGLGRGYIDSFSSLSEA